MSDERPEYFGANGPAYAKREERVGPPLSYVSEKLKSAILSSHALWGLAQRDIPDDLPQPTFAKNTPYKVKDDSVLSPCYASFRFGLTAFLALHNMLDIANEKDVFKKLLQMGLDEFESWLGRIEAEGSIHGK